MRKKLCMLLAMVLTGTSLAACAKEETIITDENTTVLTLALREGIYADVIKECLPAFESEHQVHCNVLELSEDELHASVSADAGNPEGAYDLCMVDGSWMAEYTSKDILLSLSGLGYELDDDIIPATTQICYHNDEIFLAPYYGNVTVLLYNKNLLKQAGYEDAAQIQSLSDVLDIAQKTKSSGNLGFMYRGDTANNYVVDFLPILLSYGGWVVDEENKPSVNTNAFKTAMQFYLELASTGEAASKDNLIMAVANNAAALAIGWPGWYTPGKNSTADYCALSGKAEAGSAAFNANVYGIWTLGIPKNAAQPELSGALLEYLMDREVQKSTVASGGVPCRYSSLQDPDILKKFPQYNAVCDALESGVYRPIMEEWPDFYGILGAEMANIMEGDKTLEEGLGDAQTRLEALFE